MDLVYGHLGEASYDTDTKKWHFARDANSKRYMHPLCPLIPSQETETNAPFDGEIRQLEKSFAGLDQKMLQELIHFSEAIDLAISQHDPTVSDLVALGNAVDMTVPSTRHRAQFSPVVAIASGAAGELLRLAVLNREILGWEDYEGVELNVMTTRSGLEAWWKGSGSKIQQVTFASQEKRASSWMAVRYQGGISILNPEIRMDLICPSNARGQIQDLPPSRLDANHIVTITSVDAGGLPFADVSFDPWNHRRFVTVDQAGHWQIWKLRKGIEYVGLWSPLEDLNGNINASGDSQETKPTLDGWARALWAVDSDTLVVANRTLLTILDLKAEPINSIEADLGLAKYSDWILDVKKDPTSQSRLLIATSSRIFLLGIRDAEKRLTKLDAAIILVSWVHFRAHEDVSLNLFVIENTVHRGEIALEDTITVALYSRMNGLASIFGFRHSNTTGRASSAFDPCLLPLPDTGLLPQDPQKYRKDKQVHKAPIFLQITSIPITSGHTMEHRSLFDQIDFYVLRVLNQDYSLSEHIYFASKVQNIFLKPPNVQKRDRIRKTPARVTNDFIVPDGVLDDFISDTASNAEESHKPSGLVDLEQRGTVPLASDERDSQLVTRSLDMQWLVDETKEKNGDSVSLHINDNLDILQEGITKKLSTVIPGANTLLELGREDFFVTDIDDATASLSALIASVVKSTSDMKSPDTASRDRATVLTTLLPQISDEWKTGHEISLLQVYESLVRSEITPLPLTVPNRVRLERDKKLRSVAAQIVLAAHTIHVDVKALSADEANEENSSTQDSNLLPVRQKGSIPSLDTGATNVDSQALSSPQPSATHLLLPSSQSLSKIPKRSEVDREFLEDPSSVSLRNLVSVAPQPRLPSKLSNVLSHWRVGDDPGSYDWEAAQRATFLSDGETMTAEYAKQDKNATRAKKRARSITGIEHPLDSTYVHTQGMSSSQPVSKRRLDARSQETVPGVSSSQMVPESSQIGGSATISSQPLAGRFAGGKKVKKGKKKGF